MDVLALEDFSGMSEAEIKGHLEEEYGAPKETLNQLQVLIAYESVGRWGCDSSSFFLMKNIHSGELFEVHGSHCSCHGFEGQFSLEETSPEYLLTRFELSLGGYDNHPEDNVKFVKNRIAELFGASI